MLDRLFGFFESRIDPLKPTEGLHPLAPPTTVWRVVKAFFAETGWAVVLMIALTSLTTAVEIAIPWMIGRIVDLVSATPSDAFLEAHWADLVAFAILLVVVRPLVTVFASLVRNQTLLRNVGVLVRWRTHEYVSRADISFFQNDFVGRIATKVGQTGQAIRSLVRQMADQLLYALLFLSGTVAFLLAQHPYFAAPVLLWAAAFVAILRVYLPRSRAAARRVSETASIFTGRIVDGYSNYMTVRLFTGVGREDGHVRDALVSGIEASTVQQRYLTTLAVTLTFMNGILLASGALIGVHLWRQELASAGDIAAVLALLVQIHGLSRAAVFNLGDVYDSIGTLEDSVRSLAKPQVVRDRADAPPLAVSRGEVRFEDARFDYGRLVEGGARRPALDGIDLTLRPGEKIGLVGPSGAGKSTLVNVLLRLYDLEGGRILIDGQDIAAVRQDSLRAAVGVVTQDTSLLHRSIRDNIGYGRPEASEDELRAAARQARADAFIEDLIDARGRRGFDAHVGERGVKLSGGQRQRIAIARVLLKNAPILVLDEATSALDSDVEAAIQESLDELMRGKTVIAIAHRLSTIARMDRLVVMDQGRIVETGTHAELVAKGGLYAGLWTRQTGGFLGLDEKEDAAAEALG
ncbi:ABC transporter ATP-binding protein [Chthonobacter rhizosphaerae]|uniref:ABC transporter ATP-binding protein n=1 Tax=Chthonobacter rhizosphaerae TaxID=2735553 RepID=UPI0015EF9D28|nr:ABC transporter ATP-binding protein [Chthonobacter rhizosphaerae]